MSNVLVITGPINAQQAGVDRFAPGTKVINVQPSTGIGSTEYAGAMQSFLGGRTLRKAVESRMKGEPIEKLGVLWFSAGHGGVNWALTKSPATDADIWLCLDGLYASWKYRQVWATKLASAAISGETKCVAVASTTTPGQYADGLSSWTYVLDYLKLKPVPYVAGVPPLFPEPGEGKFWSKGKFTLLGYPKIGHLNITPAVREGMMRAWVESWKATGTEPTPEPPGPPPGPPQEPPVDPKAPVALGLGASLAWGALGVAAMGLSAVAGMGRRKQ